jgi:hypothetical protein
MSELLLKLAQLKYPTFPLKVTIPQATVRHSSLTIVEARTFADNVVHGSRDLLLLHRL